VERLLEENREALIRAISRDYGRRSEFETLFGEYWVALQSITSAIRHLRRWMRPQRRAIDHLLYPGAGNRVIPQPLAVVGVIVP
jgi:coniferyl-aldehyde dehydrogenase